MGKQIDEKSGFDPSFMMKLSDLRKKKEAEDEKEAKGKKKPPASAKKEELLRELERLESTPSPFPEARERRVEQLRTILERGGGMDPSFMMKLSDLRKKKEAEDEEKEKAAKAKDSKKKK